MKHIIAVVIGIGAYNDLGMIRSCGEAGMHVVLLAPKTMIVPIYRSKYVKDWIDTDVNDEFDVIKNIRLITTHTNEEKDIVLFPTSDKVAIFIDRHKSEIPKRVLIPDAGMPIEYLMDKYEMCSLASNAGMEVPTSKKYTIDEAISVQPFFPVIVKPLKSALGEKADISICHSDKDWEKALIRFSSHNTPSILIQELITGYEINEVAVTGVSIKSGKIFFAGTILKKRIHGNGSTVYGTYIPEVDEKLKTCIAKYMKSIYYSGIFDIEFIYNGSDYYFIECNYRNGAYGYAVTAAGFNLPKSFVDGDNYILPEQHVVTFMEERTDVLHAINGDIPKSTWIKEALLSHVLLWWNWRDPMPILCHYWNKVHNFKSRHC